MLDTLAGWGISPPVVVADAAYGSNAHLRAGLAQRGIDYMPAVRADVSAHPFDVQRVAPDRKGPVDCRTTTDAAEFRSDRPCLVQAGNPRRTGLQVTEPGERHRPAGDGHLQPAGAPFLVGNSYRAEPPALCPPAVRASRLPFVRPSRSTDWPTVARRIRTHETAGQRQRAVKTRHPPLRPLAPRAAAGHSARRHLLQFAGAPTGARADRGRARDAAVLDASRCRATKSGGTATEVGFPRCPPVEPWSVPSKTATGGPSSQAT